jgi:hypothetical protein
MGRLELLLELLAIPLGLSPSAPLARGVELGLPHRLLELATRLLGLLHAGLRLLHAASACSMPTRACSMPISICFWPISVIAGSSGAP